MKTLHIGKYFTPFKGGIENMMLELMREQVKQGLTVGAVVHHHEKKRASSRQVVDGCNIWRIRIQGVLLFVPIALTAIYHLSKVIKQFKPDVLHCHLPNVTCFWLLFLPRARKIPWVLHWHSDVVGDRPHWAIKLLYPFYRVFEKALIKRSKVIIATSNNYLNTSIPLRNFRQKCTVIPLGLPDTSEVIMPYTDSKFSLKNQHSTSFDRSEDIFTLLCVGRLTYYKGHKHLIEALALLGQTHYQSDAKLPQTSSKPRSKNKRIMLRIVGSGEEQASLRKLVDHLGLCDDVIFLSHLEDQQLAKELASCDALVLPSIERTEAFGLVLLEAMRAGKPCICTDVKGSGMSEVVIHGETGLVAQAADKEAMKVCIETLAHNIDSCYAKGKSGRDRFLAHFTVSHTTTLVNRCYHHR